jgi:hypothetical protein
VDTALEALGTGSAGSGLLTVIAAGLAILLVLKLVGVVLRISSRVATWGLLAAIVVALLVLYQQSQEGPAGRPVMDQQPRWSDYGGGPFLD